MDVNLEHSENATLSIVLSCEPEVNIIDTKLIQVKNAFSPIDVTESGMGKDVKLLQPLNASLAIVRSCEPEANVTVLKPVQLRNARTPIDVTVKPPNVLGISNCPAYVCVKLVIVAFPTVVV